MKRSCFGEQTVFKCYSAPWHPLVVRTSKWLVERKQENKKERKQESKKEKRKESFTCAHLLSCSTLSQCCHAAVALLYPFVWQHTYIPVLPPAMLDIVCTPTPFIVGLLSSSLSQLTELPLEEVGPLDRGSKVIQCSHSGG